MGYEIHWESPRGVSKRLYGAVTGDELLASNVNVEADPCFDSLRYVINDFRDCTGLSIQAGQVEEIAAIDSAAASINPNINIAIVATLPEILAGAEAYATDSATVYPTRVFSSMDDAKAWALLYAGNPKAKKA